MSSPGPKPLFPKPPLYNPNRVQIIIFPYIFTYLYVQYYLLFVGCADGWTIFKHNRRCYQYFRGDTTWAEALAACQAEPQTDSTLASIHDIQTNDFLTELSGGNDDAWIGGFQDANEM